MTARKRTTKPPMSRKAKKTLLQGLVLVGGILVLVTTTLAVTGVFGRKPDTALALASDASQAARMESTGSADPAAAANPETTADPSAVSATESPSTQNSAEVSGTGTDSAAAGETAGNSASASPVAAEASSPATTPASGHGKATVSPAASAVAPETPKDGAMTLSEALAGGAESAASAAPDSTAGPATEETLQDEDVAATGNWIETAIAKNRDRIDDADLADFRAIIAKLDQSAIYGWAGDGFTGDEQTLLIEHLHARLSDTEYARAKELFRTYSFVLDTL